jgi:RNA 3'-terminal phosphate cyclase (ATP)
MLIIDGSMGEGGGQVLRSSLSLSLLTGTAVRIANIRAGRARPGLMRQHLTAVNAAAAIGAADVVGAEIGSRELEFRPKAIRGGDYTFATGGAGSTTLVFQTVLYPLLLGANAPSTLRLEGGTHNPMAPPVDFLEHALLPLLGRMGARIAIGFERHGFHPNGGGAWTATIDPTPGLARLELLQRGAVLSRRATALVAQVPPSVAVREIDTLAATLGWDRSTCRPSVIKDSHGPGNALMATIESEHVTEVFTGFGERGRRAENVADGVAKEARRYLDAGVPVGEHLADQLLLPMALGCGGVFRTLAPSAHSVTQIALLRLFLDVQVSTHEEAHDAFCVEVRRPANKFSPRPGPNAPRRSSPWTS